MGRFNVLRIPFRGDLKLKLYYKAEPIKLHGLFFRDG